MTTEQLLRLSEESHAAFKKHQVTAALFLDAEAAFDRCWHEGIMYKLKKSHLDIVKIICLMLIFGKFWVVGNDLDY